MTSIKILFLLILSLGAIAAARGRPLEFGSIPYSRDISNSPQPTRADYLLDFPESPFRIHNIEAYRRTGRPQRDEEGRVILTVNHRLLGAHAAQFETYMADLRGEGFDVTLLDVEGGTAEELKDAIIQAGGEEAVGVVLAGELPLAWFEQLEYFDSNDEPDNQRLAEFPIDLFFMDWDGEWIDTSANGIYDGHRGNWQPDVWLGRIAAYNLSRISEDSLITLYLDRLHAYRQGELTLPHRALGYIDDDWEIAAREWGEEMTLASGFVDVVSDPDATSARGYAQYLEEGYELVQVAVHSTADSNAFLIDHRRSYDYFRFSNLRDGVSPQTFFYNLFACSAMNLRRNLSLGALYSLKPPYALGAVGSSKVGGMLFYEDYYAPLGEGESFGEALKHWLTLHAHEAGHENWSRSWFYGMTHFGDPTLRLPRGLGVIEFEVIDDQGDGDGVPDAGETAAVRLFVTNRSQRAMSAVQGFVTSEDTFLIITQQDFAIEDISADEVVEVDGVRIEISSDAPDLHKVVLTVRMTPHNEVPWWDRVSFEVRNAKLQPVRFASIASEDDEDGFVGPGEFGNLFVTFRNIGGDAMDHQSDVLLQPLDNAIDFTAEHSQIEALNPGEQGISQAAEYRVHPDADPTRCGLVRLTVRGEGIDYGRGVMAIPTSEGASFSDEFDNAPAWIEHVALTEGYADVWRWDSTAGEQSGGLAFGGPDTLLYPPRSDAALELPLMILDADAELQIRHAMDVEAEYDACVIEVNRGREWSRATPVGGYNGRSVEIGAYVGGPCWNGSFGWREDRVRFGGPSGPIRVRLRFASDNGVEGGGWQIDRLTVTGTNLERVPEASPPYSSMLLEAYPNPFNSTLRVRYSTPDNAFLRMFSANGELVREMRMSGEPRLMTAAIDYSNFPPGLYFLKLEAGQQVLVRKIVLVK